MKSLVVRRSVHKMSSTISIPPTHRALWLSEIGKPLIIIERPVPQPETGTVIIKVLASIIEGGLKSILENKFGGLHCPVPFTPGGRAVGRVVAIGSDTTTLNIGQLVLTEPFVRGRDNTSIQFVWGAGVFGNNLATIKLSRDVWRDGTCAEYARSPLENTHALDEALLLGSPTTGGLGYNFANIPYISRALVPYGGFRGINLQAGETVIVAPATGGSTYAAVEVAIAMGANVIAVGRNLSKLQKVESLSPSGRVRIYHLQDDPKIDVPALKAFGVIDAFLDLSPYVANESTHVGSCMLAVRNYGRVSLMGVLTKDINLPYAMAVHNNLTIQGKYMYERSDVKGIIKLVESGRLKLGKHAGHEVLEFKLDDFDDAVEAAAKSPGMGHFVVMTPL